MNILVTGVAGFIGAHVARALLEQGHQVTGIDNMSDYYDVALKERRIREVVLGGSNPEKRRFDFRKLDIADRQGMEALFGELRLESVVHLAAQPGVRHSIDHPHAYVESNMLGFLNVLEGCRRGEVGHLVYASSSSIYGANTQLPFMVQHNVDHPLSIYAASKKSNELMAHAYAHLFGLPTTGLRFFTVYGPWGRPDMAPMKFARAILRGQPIQVYNEGKHARDFTYVDDVVEGVVRILQRPAVPDPAWDASNPDPARSNAPWRLYNVGNHQPIKLMRFIEVLEDTLGVKADKQLLPMQAGDVADTFADVKGLADEIGFRPTTTLEEGIGHFVDWYRRHEVLCMQNQSPEVRHEA